MIAAWSSLASAQAPATRKTTKAAGDEPAPVRASTSLAPPTPPGATGGSTLVLIVDAEPDVNKSAVVERVRRAAEAVQQQKGRLPEGQKFPASGIMVELLSRQTFEIMARFILDGRLPDTGSDPKVGGLERDQDAFTLKLGGPYALDELIVEYASPPGEAALKPQSFKPGDPRVSRTMLGVYRIKGIVSEAGPPPSGYTIKRNDGLNPIEPLKGTWPKENSYWQVTIDRMGDDQAELFEKLADENLFATPLVKKQVSERKLALGSMLKVQTDGGGVTIVGNRVTLRFFKPSKLKQTPTRVWIKFPIWADEEKTQLARYASLNEFELPEKIESESPIRAGESSATLLPRPAGSGADARWYEILPKTDGQVYERELEIDSKLWARDLSGPPVRWLIVWQKDDGRGGNKEAFEFKDPVAAGIYKVKSEEVAGWAVEVKSAASRP